MTVNMMLKTSTEKTFTLLNSFVNEVENISVEKVKVA